MSDMELSESLEDYLIVIADLGAGGEGVHSRNVAERVGVSTASVTHAFRALHARGLIEYQRYQAVRITPAGREAARRVMHRKRTLLRLFRDVLELDEEEAEQNAHRIEHVISPAAIERIGILVDRFDRDGEISPERPGPTDQ